MKPEISGKTMSKIFLKISEDLKIALRAKRKNELSVLRMLLAAIKNKKIELIAKDELTDEQIFAVIKSEIKKRKDSIEAYANGQRPDLVDQESAEIKILEKYCPAQMSEAEIEKIVEEVISSIKGANMSNFGQVMGQVMGRTKGQAEGNAVSALVKKILSS